MAAEKSSEIWSKVFGPFQVFKMMNNIVAIDVDGEIMTVNVHQVRVYRFREDVSEGCQISNGISQIPR